MAKRNDHKEDEDLKGQLRSVIKENKALRRRLKTLERSKHVWNQYNLDADEIGTEEIKPIPEQACPSCFKGTLMFIDLGIKDLTTCSSCTYRKVSLKNG